MIFPVIQVFLGFLSSTLTINFTIYIKIILSTKIKNTRQPLVICFTNAYKPYITVLKLITEWDQHSAETLLFSLCFNPILLSIQLQ